MNTLFKALQGRTTAFGVYFALTGTAFHAYHRLDSTFISFMTVLMGFVLGHSYKEDKFNSGGNGNVTTETVTASK